MHQTSGEETRIYVSQPSWTLPPWREWRHQDADLCHLTYFLLLATCLLKSHVSISSINNISNMLKCSSSGRNICWRSRSWGQVKVLIAIRAAAEDSKVDQTNHNVMSGDDQPLSSGECLLTSAWLATQCSSWPEQQPPAPAALRFPSHLSSAIWQLGIAMWYPD